MKLSTDDLKRLCEKQFGFQNSMLPLWQSLADNFYPQRADFTVTRNVGAEVSAGLMNSYPVLIRNDLGGALAAMLRDGHWYDIDVEHTPDKDGAAWLQDKTTRLLALMNGRLSGFSRATVQCDHDFVTFGCGVITVERNKTRDGLLYRNWHIRDCAWWDDVAGNVEGVVRKWTPDVVGLIEYFGDSVHPDVKKKRHEEPFSECNVRHIFMPSEMYGDDEITDHFPFISIYLDIDHDHLMEVMGIRNRMYVIPRFQTIAGSAYAYSPATIIALPDARALQAMTHTLIEAAERYVSPPIVATREAIRGDVDLGSNGVTWVTADYDERLGEAIRQLPMNSVSFPIGLDARDGVVKILAEAFYLDKLDLPNIDKTMTAYEVSELMKQFRRKNLPLFSPIEADYSAQLCETSFDISLYGGLLGSHYDIPDSLSGADVTFIFKSPLAAAEEEKKVTRWQQVSAMLADASQLDPGVTANINIDAAFRDAVKGTGAPARWLTDREYVMESRKRQQMQEAAMMAKQMMGQGQGQRQVGAVN